VSTSKTRSPSTLRLALLWLGLAAVGTAVMVGVLTLRGRAESVRALTAQAIHEAPIEPVLDEAEPEPVEGEVAVAGMEGEEAEVPVVEEPETLDPVDELEMAPAERPEGLGKVAVNAAPHIEAATIETIVGPRPWIVHKVAPLETVDQVAHRYGVLPEVLRRWNGLKADANELGNGARLKVKARQIPPRRLQIDYVVQEGDTWWSIATRYGVDSQELRAANWETPRKLVVGETLSLWIDPVVFHWLGEAAYDGGTAGIPLVRRGAVGIGPPQQGRLVNGVQIPAGPGYARKMLPSSYGTTHAVLQLTTALHAFHETAGYEGELLLGSMSRRHGGPIEGHVSHQTGRDVDVRLPLLADVPTWFPLKPWRVDWAALWHLLRALDATGHVQIVFLDYSMQKNLYKVATDLGVEEDERRRMLQWPRGEKAHLGVVRHSPGHEQHIHVRFDCGAYETECVMTDGLPDVEDG
jgi:LysM repeat protein